MGGRRTEVDAYVAASDWREPLAALRTILLDLGLDESVKWAKPCYSAEGGNIAALSGLKDECWLMLFKGALLDDPDGVLDPPGEHSRSMRVVRFIDAAEVAAREPALRALVGSAIEAERSGLRVPPARTEDLVTPEELVQSFDADPDLAAAFEALTPGRQRGWLLQFGGAKQSVTRAARIARAAPLIRQGKGPNDR